MKILPIFFPRLRHFVDYKIYWHRFVPFVIAEAKNHEWEKLREGVEAGKFPVLSKIWNSDGGWYICEGLDFFLFGREWYTSTEHHRIFGDSMQLNCYGLPDDSKWNLLYEDAIYDIDLILDGPNKLKLKQ